MGRRRGAAIWRQAWIERWADRYYERLAERLSLRPDQIDALKASREKMRVELRELQQETRLRAGQIIRAQRQHAWQQLDDAQRQKLLEMQEYRTDGNKDTQP